MRLSECLSNCISECRLSASTARRVERPPQQRERSLQLKRVVLSAPPLSSESAHFNLEQLEKMQAMVRDQHASSAKRSKAAMMSA